MGSFEVFLSPGVFCHNGFTESGVNAESLKEVSTDSRMRESAKWHRIPMTHWVRSIRAHFARPKYPDTLTHWVQVVRESLHPLGARMLGCLCWGRGCSGARESLGRGEGVGPAGSMVRLRRHHRTRENFFKNQKPNGSINLPLHSPRNPLYTHTHYGTRTPSIRRHGCHR